MPAAAAFVWPSSALCQRLSAAGAFLVPALALCVPSGYSWGALLLLCASVLAVRHWWGIRPDRSTRYLLAAIAAMGLVWMLGWATGDGLRGLDRMSKYILVLPCVLYLRVWPPQRSALCWGLIVGAIGSGIVALYQTQVVGWERATGFTNAIQYGNLSVLLALMCALWLLAGAAQLTRMQHVGLLLGVVLAVLGSLLSQSRGGWLAVAISLPLWVVLVLRGCARRWVLRAAALLCVLVLGVGAIKGPVVVQRLTLAYDESVAYWHTGQARTSIGQRWEHWRLAWSLGLERPIAGWGESGYIAQKRHRVELGQADAVLLDFDHAHNEFLDMFAKRGVLGLGGILVLYALPVVLFWPTRQRAPQGDAQALALCWVGLALPVSYIGFGLTQVFLAHNSGNMFYLFMLALCFAALYGPHARPVPIVSASHP